MRKSTKFFAMLAVALGICSTQSFAQDMMNTTSTMGSTTMKWMDFKIGVGVNGGVATKDSRFSYGLGADVKLQWDLSPYVALTGSGGYTRLMVEDGSVFKDYQFIPAIGGVKVFPVGRMFINGLIGAGFGIDDNSKTSFIFGGGVGYEWQKGLEIGVRYEGYQQDASSSTYAPVNGQYALRLGYNF